MQERLPAMRVLDCAHDAIAAGAKLVPVYGSPVLVMPEHVQIAVAGAAHQVHERETRGSMALRETIADHLQVHYSLHADPQHELLITHGAMHGLSVTFRALFDAGDEVIVPSPTFFFDASLRSSGATPVYVECLEEENWRWDIDRLEDARTNATRGVLVCNPNNPTAYVPTRYEVEAVVQWAAGNGLIIVADEAYARYVFDGGTFTPQMTFRDIYPEMVTVTSLTKNYAFANWRVGYVYAPEHLLAAIHQCFEWDALDVGPVPQAAATAVIDGPQDWIEPVLATYQPNRDRLMVGLADIGLSAVRPAGGPFALVNFSTLGLSGRELEDALLNEGVAAVAGDGFKGPASHARIMFGGSVEAVGDLLEALQAVSVKYSGRSEKVG